MLSVEAYAAGRRSRGPPEAANMRCASRKGSLLGGSPDRRFAAPHPFNPSTRRGWCRDSTLQDSF